MEKDLFSTIPMRIEPVDAEKVFRSKNVVMAYTEEELKKELETKEYEYGFYTDIESDTFPVGLNEDIIRAISKRKEEPEWMTEWRLQAFAAWKEMEEPEWANVHYEKPDFQAISYYSAPKKKDKYKSLDEVDPELLETFNKLGISIDEQKKLAGVAVDIVMDSVSVATTFRDTLAEKGIIFCSISEAIKEHPEFCLLYTSPSPRDLSTSRMPSSA